MEIKLSKWNVIWIFHVFIVKLLEGLATPQGELIFRPSSVMTVGANLTMICINKRLTCPGNTPFLFEINDDMKNPDWQNQTMSMIQLVHIRKSCHVVCYVECYGLKHVMNMAWFQVGYPPDPPTNVMCSLEEFSTEMKCEWGTGKITHLPTHYEVHLKNLQTLEAATKSTTEAVVSFPVNITENEKHQIQIFAANQLNQSESEVVQFHLADIVIPFTPVIKKINVSDTSLMIYIHWRNQTSENQRYCEVEYKTINQLSWALAGKEININNTVSLKKIRNADSLRVRCREDFGKCYWSKWSDPHQIPPSAPEESPNVWRLLGRKRPDGTQEVTILFASDLDDLPRINVSAYEVYFYKQERRTNLTQCPSSVPPCAVLIPKGVETVSIAAYNSYGSSPAIDLPIQEEDGSGPQNVTVKPLHPTSLSVQWQRPLGSAEPLRWFILQWTSETCDGKHTTVSWQKAGKQQRNFTITDNIAPGQRVTISVYAVYSTRVSKPSTAYGYTQEFKPRTGPSSIKIVKSSANTRVIEWAELPLCDRRGFITNYTVYIKPYRNESNVIYVPGSTRQVPFDTFNPDEQYSVCISASTRAGEGPADHCMNFQEGNDFNSYVGLLVGMAFGVIVLSTFILTLSRIRKRVKIGLLLLLPKCLHEEYPHVERSLAVRSLQTNKESPDPVLSLLTIDPEVLEIEELPKEVTSYPMTSVTAAQETNEPPLIPPADIEVPELTPGYKPQIANVTFQKRDSYCSPSHMLDLQKAAMGSRICSNSMFSSDNTDIFHKMNLMVTMDVDLDDEPLQSATNPTLQSLWENQTFIDRLVMPDAPEEEVICTPSLLQEFDDTKTYFPQTFTGGL